MDLVIETDDFKFCLDGLGEGFVSMFMANVLKISVKRGYIYLNKKDMKRLIEFLKTKKDKFKVENYYNYIIDNFTSMEMLMEERDRASFYFW